MNCAFNHHTQDTMTFLGTAGARFVVARQLRASGGTWLRLGEKQLLIDPGPGSLLRCLAAQPRLHPPALDGIILTHRHLDHSNDINVMIEAMTNGGRDRRGFVLAPRDAVEVADPVIQQYVRAYVDELDYLEVGKTFSFNTFSLSTPVAHHHSVETYGLRFSLPYGTISIIADTAYFDELIDCYKGTDLLVLNVVIYQDTSPSAYKIYHLNFSQALALIEAIRPRAAVLTHFGMTMLQHNPHLLAARIEEKTGVRVLAATDGLELSILGQLQANQVK